MGVSAAAELLQTQGAWLKR